MNIIKITALIFLLTGCQTMTKKHPLDQPFSHLDYLEKVEGTEALAFARKNNAASDARLKTDPRYQPAYDEILKIVSAKDKLPVFFNRNDELYNFWQDAVHVKGLLRKTTIKSLNSGKPKWHTVLDVDALAKAENENWVYKGMTCLAPDYKLCLISLSRGGKDAHIMREFDLKKEQFVQNGFFIPESKSQVAWVNKDTLLLSDATNPATLTPSGYPSEVKALKRGGDIQTTPVLFKGSKKSVSAGAFSHWDGTKHQIYLYDGTSFFESIVYVYDFKSGKKTRIPIPTTANFETDFEGQYLFTLREPYEGFAAGSLLAISDLNSEKPALSPIFNPTKTTFLETVSHSKNHLWVVTLNDVKKQILKYTFKKGKWSSESFRLSNTVGNENLGAISNTSHHVYFEYSDFLTPTKVFYFNENQKSAPTAVLKSPPRFKASGFKISQHKVKSKDGTLVPYFLVAPKNMKLNSKNPTLLYGYGGFEIAMTASYLGSTGKAWLEKGGVYVLSNIRGGGEYGPDWHRGVLRENRHKAYEDFFAIAEDLIAKKITQPKHLGIRGGSNGGLLTSVAFTQRPELFNAVISEVPLANMLEYHQWLAGASWMEEYGDPEDKKMRAYLASYSPLHSLSKDKKYPEVFYLTSTKDDRVHPAHARQMVARMQELGHPVLYNENVDGGHGRASNMKDLAEFLALEFTYLYQKLF